MQAYLVTLIVLDGAIVIEVCDIVCGRWNYTAPRAAVINQILVLFVFMRRERRRIGTSRLLLFARFKHHAYERLILFNLKERMMPI